MSEQTALVPTEIRAIEFYGDQVTGALVQVADEAQIYIPLRPLCDYLHLDWSSQRKRINRDEVLRDEVRGVVIMTTPQGGRQEMLCLPLDLLPGWLFGITTGKMTDATLREKITRYRRECYRRLWEAFRNDIIAPQPPVPSNGAALAYELATAVQSLAREQMELEQRMNNAAQWAKDINKRVTALEVRLPGTDDEISNRQAAEVALSVKNVGYALEQRGVVPGYPRVYAELYRRYSINSYKNLPQSRYDEVLMWLRSWYDEIVGDGTER